MSIHEPWEPRLRHHAWILRHMPTDAELTRQRMAVRRWIDPPLLSVLTPVYNTPPELLRRMLRSIQRQTYPHWELCLVDDGSPLHWTAPFLSALAARDPRIRFHRRARNGGIVAASNDALALATGIFVVLVDDDDELDPRALHAVAEQIRERPDTDVLYTDFDVIGTDGVRVLPMLAPDWSPELLHSMPYLAHLTAYRREIVERVGGFRPEYEGSQDYDLALRVTAMTERIVHIPRVLYHWRAWSRSAAGNPDAKPYAYENGVRAIIDHLRDHPFQGRREEGPAIGCHAVRYAIKGDPLVSLIVPMRIRNDTPALPPFRPIAAMRQSLIALARHTTYARRECLVVGPGEHEAALIDGLDEDVIESLRLRYVSEDQEIGTERYADANVDAAIAANAAVASARGEHLLFLGDNLEPMDDDWMSAMLEFSQQPGVGAVGAKIYLQDGIIWHAGIVVPRANPHLARLDDRLTRNYSAVSGACLMTRRDLFDAVRGFEPAARVGCSDVDYCLRLRASGQRIVLTPHARLRHLAPPPPEADAIRRQTFHARWSADLPFDPYYNRAYRQDAAWFVLALD
jgi:GT2 family glycosyltransferase